MCNKKRVYDEGKRFPEIQAEKRKKESESQDLSDAQGNIPSFLKRRRGQHPRKERQPFYKEED